jgi:hypothetical protein
VVKLTEREATIVLPEARSFVVQLEWCFGRSESDPDRRPETDPPSLSSSYSWMPSVDKGDATSST